MYFRKNEDSSLLDWSEAKYADDCLYTEKAIVQAWNGLSYIEGEEPEEPTQMKMVRIQRKLTDAVQRVLDKKAQELNYDNCLSVCSYIDTDIPKFDAEGKAFRKWRSAVWAKGYEILALVKKGEMAIPTEEELIAMLPKLVIEYTE